MCYTTTEIRQKIEPIAKKYGIQTVSLFGSYARGTATDESDIDLYIDKGKLRSLLQYFAFVYDLEQEFQCHVDVVTTEISDKAFLSGIFKEGVLVYPKTSIL